MRDNQITPEDAKFWRDKHVLETPDPLTMAHLDKKKAVEILGVDPDNYDKIKGIEPTPEFKEASQAFVHPKMHLAELFYDTQPIYYDDSGSFWLWNNGTKSWFRLERDEDLMNMIQGSLGADTINSRERGEIMQALKQVGRSYRPQEIPKTWIQFRNGFIDINDSGTLKESNPDYFAVNPIPWNLGKSADTPTMDKIFEEWVGKKYVQTLYEIIAYCLLPSYPIHRIFCFIGSGMNGKSKFLDLLRKFVGIKNITATELDILLASRFEITRLYKKLVCQMGETNFNEMNRTSILKKLTGGDMIGFEYKNKNTFESENYAKIIISTNNLPTTSDKTIGFYRRWLIIDFPNQFSEKKNILEDIPDVEYENLALKSVNILKELLVKREFTNEGSIEERIKKYEDHSDPIEKFLKEFTIDDLNGTIWKFEFEKRLNEWCKENKFRQISEVAIAKKMKDKGVITSQKTSDWFIDGQKKILRCWVGLKWKTLNELSEKLNEPLDSNSQASQASHLIPTSFTRVWEKVELPVKSVQSVKQEINSVIVVTPIEKILKREEKKDGQT